jgi:hypothetical protein
MSKRNTHLGAARRHGRKAATELRRMTADSALHWILAHKARVAQFRRAIKGTRAASPFDQLLAAIRDEATTLRARKPRRARRATSRKSVRRRRAGWAFARPAYGTFF